MLFRKKPRENIKVAKFRMLEPQPLGGRFSGRLAMGLVAPFIIVALVLWVFSKQATVISSKSETDSPSSTTLPIVAQTPSPMNVAPPEAVTTAEPLPVTDPLPPKAEEPQEQKAQQPVKKITAPKPKKPSLPIATRKEEPNPSAPPVKKEDVAAAAPKKTPEKKAHAKPSRVAKSPVKPTPATTAPLLEDTAPITPVKIRAGRPRSPMEEKSAARQKTSSDKSEKQENPSPEALQVAKIEPSPHISAPPEKTARVSDRSENKISSRSYRIQVGSFQKKEDAETLAFRLKERGYATSVVLAEIPNKGTWHRVWVGTYTDRPTAEKEAEKLLVTEKVSFFIVTSGP